MDYLTQLYQKLQELNYRRQRNGMCYYQCAAQQTISSESFLYCYDGCSFYKDDQQNDFNKTCDEYRYAQNLLVPGMMHLKYRPNLVFTKCKQGMKNMEKILADWRADEEKNGKKTIKKDIMDFLEDPDVYVNQRNFYYADPRLMQREEWRKKYEERAKEWEKLQKEKQEKGRNQ